MSLFEESRKHDSGTRPSSRIIGLNDGPSQIVYRTPSRQVGVGSRLGSRSNIYSRTSLSPSMDVRETLIVNKEFDPATGSKCINQYIIQREIGRGVYGKVKLAINQDTKQQVAIKIVSKKSKRKLGQKATLIDPQQEKIRKEIAILKKCDHLNIVRLLEVIDNPASEKIYLVLEYLQGGEVKWRSEEAPIKPLLDENTIRKCMRDVIAGVQYLHYQGIIHRDIKPANLLWTDDHRIKISDFGVSVFLGKPSQDQASNLNSTTSSQFALDTTDLEEGEIDMGKTAGSPAFFAPEMCDVHDAGVHNLSSFEMGMAIDVWAIGITLFCFVYGVLPFNANSEYEMFRAICNDPLIFPVQEVTPDLLDLFPKILEKNPANRYSLLNIKHHSWLTLDLSLDDQAIYFEETNPALQSLLHVTDQEVQSAVNILTSIRTSFRKFSTSIINFTQTFTQKRSGSMSTDISLIKTKSNVSGLSGDPSNSTLRHSVGGGCIYGTESMPRRGKPRIFLGNQKSSVKIEHAVGILDSSKVLDLKGELSASDDDEVDEGGDACEKRRISEWNQAYAC